MDSNIQKIVEKRFTTAIIAALAAFEEEFSTAWTGSTERHREWLESWNIVRDNVLNKGHFQKRLLLKELESFLNPNK